jgi:hypothetical protein
MLQQGALMGGCGQGKPAVDFMQLHCYACGGSSTSADVHLRGAHHSLSSAFSGGQEAPAATGLPQQYKDSPRDDYGYRKPGSWPEHQPAGALGGSGHWQQPHMQQSFPSAGQCYDSRQQVQAVADLRASLTALSFKGHLLSPRGPPL